MNEYTNEELHKAIMDYYKLIIDSPQIGDGSLLVAQVEKLMKEEMRRASTLVEYGGGQESIADKLRSFNPLGEESK